MKDTTPLWMRAGGLCRGGRDSRVDEHARLPGAVLRPQRRRDLRVGQRRGFTCSGTSTCCCRCYLRGHCNLTMLLSKHRDADMLFRLAHHMGFECVRGSTYSGGDRGADGAVARGQADAHGDHARRAARAAAATRAGAGVLGVAIGAADRADGVGLRSAVASQELGPVCRSAAVLAARGVVGPEVYIPPDLDRDELEQRRQGVERLLNATDGRSRSLGRKRRAARGAGPRAASGSNPWARSAPCDRRGATASG